MAAIMTRLALALMLATPAFAGQVTYTVQSAQVATPSTTVVSLPQFDPALGALTGVVITADVNAGGQVGIENVDLNVALDSTFQVVSGLSVTTHGLFAWGAAVYPYSAPVSLMPFDGTVDFAGPSGSVHSIPSFQSATFGVTMAMAGSNLDGYTGTSAVDAHLYLGSSVGVLGALNPTTATQLWAQATVSVQYTFGDYPIRLCTPGPATFQCPCGSQWTGMGCENSQGHGADLSPFGQSSLSTDTFQLFGSGLPPSTSALLFQGNHASHVGTAFGNGRRCASGGIVRLGIKTASQGIVLYPDTGPLLSIAGNIPSPGQFRAYQVWYRDPFAFCTAGPFNLTNAVATVWLP